MADQPSVEIVLPVHNEERIVASSVERLHAYLSNGFPFSWRIVIADNGSTDATLSISRRLAEELPSVDVVAIADPDGAELSKRRGADPPRMSSPTPTLTCRLA